MPALVPVLVVLAVGGGLAQEARRTWRLMPEDEARTIVTDAIGRNSVPQPTLAIWNLPPANLYVRGAITSDGVNVVFASAWAGQYPLVPKANLGEVRPGLMQVPTTPLPGSTAPMMLFALNGVFVTSGDLEVTGDRLVRLDDSDGPWSRAASIPKDTYLWHVGNAGIYLESRQSRLLVAFRTPNSGFAARTAYLPALSLGHGQQSIVFAILEDIEFR